MITEITPRELHKILNEFDYIAWNKGEMVTFNTKAIKENKTSYPFTQLFNTFQVYIVTSNGSLYAGNFSGLMDLFSEFERLYIVCLEKRIQRIH